MTLEQLAEQTHLSKSALGSYEADEYAGVVDKFNKTVDKLNVYLHDAAYYKKWAGTIYGH